LITDLCIAFEGKILKTTGDGVLMYFISGVQATACVIEIQNKFASFEKNNSDTEHFTHRIGIHLGDIFFNQEDIMGTSVNIAARLESEAKPGAICMSQVVYEVVKYRLNLDAVYAGELSLKNIDQSVSAYHVWPPEVTPPKSAEQFSEAIFSLVTPLNTALKIFSSHPQNHRIKKLLYAAHHGIWESNPDILKSVSLKLLVESLTNRNANLTECQSSLDAIVGTLNQPERYGQIAKVILETIKDFYIDENSEGPAIADIFCQQTDAEHISAEDANVKCENIEDGALDNGVPFRSAEPSHIQRDPIDMWDSLSSIIRNLNSSRVHEPTSQIIFKNLKEFYAERGDGSRVNIANSAQLERVLENQRLDKTNLHREIAERLSSSKDNVRVKQLLYCVCCGQWENHIDRIQAIPMLSLVQGLGQKFDSLELLRDQLHRILSRLECRTVYTLVSDNIFKEIHQLYSDKSISVANNVHFRRGNWDKAQPLREFESLLR
ncbi:MAG: adenylate/guanylate cyclase domain-containing protein, partial [Cyanobacteria bacterium P01_D01_bin.105]